MTLVQLVDPEEMSPALREYMEGYREMVGDTAFSRMMANVPGIFVRFNELYSATLQGNVEAALKELGRLRLSTLNGCENCRYGNAFFAEKYQISRRKISEIQDYSTSDAFTAREKAALRLADRFIQLVPPKPLEAEMLANLREHFSDADIVELCCFFSLTMGFQRMNALVDLEYSCALPAPAAISA
jgi:alkylhydroperoxidase family enzyme